MMIERELLERYVASELPGQRWFGANAVTGIEAVQEIEGKLTQVIVRGDDGSRYQTVLGVRDDGLLVDATTDHDLALSLLHQAMPDEDAAKVRPLGVEQSNTSLVFDERLVFKLFRRLPDGRNPDVEVTSALADLGFEHVIAPLGTWRDDDADFAIVNELLLSSTDGWQLAMTSLRDLYDRRCPPEEAPADFGFEAERLGRVTAQLHEALSEAFPVGDADVDSWIDDMEAQLERVSLPDDLAPAARAVYEAVRSVDVGPAFRIHGDYHLGQTLLTDLGWYVLDFEGEPARPVAERRRPSSPLRDVAGMVRSFHYAAEAALRQVGSEDEEDRRLAGAWERHVAERFLAGYEGYEPLERLLPPTETRPVVQRAFELDKAIYEVGYETAHRPDWVGIPLAAVRRLLAEA